MKFGMNMYVWTTDLSDQYLYLLDRIKAWGYDGVEIPVAPQNARNYLKIKHALDNAGLKCTTITNVGIDANPISPLAAVRQKAIDQLNWAIEISALLGSENLVGPYFAAYGVFSGCGPTEEELHWSAGVMKAVAKYANQANGLELSLEFLNRFEIYLLNTTSATVRLLDLVDEPNIGILYDTHHAHHEENCVRKAITTGDSKISYVHFSENQRGTLGSGLVDWQTTVEALREIGYDGWVTAEAFSKNVPGLATAGHVWRNCFDSPEQFAADSIQFMRHHFPESKPSDPVCNKPTKNHLWQIMPSMAFKTGLYDGVITVRDAREHGNHGLGQFAALDGELIVVDGNFYRAKSDGSVGLAGDDDELCFAELCFYATNSSWDAPNGLTELGMQQFLGHVLTFHNSYCAFKIVGRFENVAVSVPPKLSKPYPRFDTVGPLRSTFTGRNIEGCVVGFYSPPFTADTGIPGYHYHFVSHDETIGGHVESFTLAHGRINAVRIDDTTLQLPKSKEYQERQLQ